MKIYTRRGDAGETGLASGERQSKTAEVFATLGDLDELNSWLGLILVSLESEPDTRLLRRAQAACLAAGAWAAAAPDEVLAQVKDTVSATDVSDLEERLDALTGELPELTSFILPGGTRLSAELQVARAVARRLERSWLGLSAAISDEMAWPIWRQYWNRLSDYLFVLARAVNHWVGQADVLWEGQS